MRELAMLISGAILSMATSQAQVTFITILANAQQMLYADDGSVGGTATYVAAT